MTEETTTAMPTPSKPKRNRSKRVYVYRLSADGQWSYGKNPMTDPELVRQFFSDIKEHDDGDHVVWCEGELCRIRVEDAPSFVEDIELQEGPKGSLRNATLRLASGAKEPLAPDTLETGRGGALYCTDRRGLRARFQRRPHLALSRYITERDGRYYLSLGGSEHEVRVTTEK